MKLRVGLVGLGEAWHQRHRPALFALRDRFEVKAVCDEVSLLAEQAAREFSAAAVDGYRALVTRDDIDAILILSPQWFGALPVLAACDAGKAVYCTSALEVDPVSAKQICTRVEETGITFMAELPRRHAPATIRLKELIATRLGAPRLLFCHHRQPVARGTGPRLRPTYQQYVTRALMEQVDWCRYVVGIEPTSVVGIGHSGKDKDGEDDYQMMSVDFSDAGTWGAGAVAQISCGHYIPGHWPEAISFRPPAALQVCCERGIAFVDLPETLTWFDSAGRHQESLESERPVGEQMLMLFHRSVTSLVRRSSDMQDAFRALRVVMSARESRQNGVRVKLEIE